MIDVSKKSNSLRTAIAESRVAMKPATLALVKEGKLPKGDALTVAKVAGIQAAKNTAQIIPYCHTLPVDFVGVNYEFSESELIIRVETRTVWKTGVEVEAVTAASVVALAIYDMTKMIDDDVVIREIRLIMKKGGKSDIKKESGLNLNAAILVLSDSVSQGLKEDSSGKYIDEKLQKEGFTISRFEIIPDEKQMIEAALRECCEDAGLIITTGGTGLGPRDAAPEATREVIEYEIPGITEMLRSYGQQRTHFAMLSRGIAGKCGKTIIINLPGSLAAVTESLDALFPPLHHAFRMIQGEGHG